ncbi:MAG: hypothetical protein OCD02_11265 [Spirochaetaceae bacterium]
MFGNNTTHKIHITYTNHAKERIVQRGISSQAIELTRKYGTETMTDISKIVTVDYGACSIAEEDGIDLYPYFSTTIVVSMDNVLKTAYYHNI